MAWDIVMTKAEELVALIAAMKQDGEDIHGEEFIMENDDAVSTLNDLIAEARKIMTKTPEQDLKEKVNELHDDLKLRINWYIDKLIASGSGVLQAHESQNCNWIEARKVFIAILMDATTGQEGLLPRSMDAREFKSDVKNYYNLI